MIKIRYPAIWRRRVALFNEISSFLSTAVSPEYKGKSKVEVYTTARRSYHREHWWRIVVSDDGESIEVTIHPTEFETLVALKFSNAK